ncbi:MAG: FeoA family protein [Syntrophaceae bacterium]
MPLAMVKAGERVRLVAVDAGYGLQARLAAMGLVPGVEIEVLRNSLRGPFIVAVNGCRMVLGHGITQKIMVA